MTTTSLNEACHLIWFDACDEQKIDDFDRAVGHANADGSAGGCDCEAFGMGHFERATVGEVHFEGVKGLGSVGPSDLLNGHAKDYTNYAVAEVEGGVCVAGGGPMTVVAGSSALG